MAIYTKISLKDILSIEKNYNLGKIIFYLMLSISLSSISFYGFRDNLLVGISCVLIMNLVILIKEKTRIINLLKLIRW